MMEIGIIGGGSIGLLLAALLDKTNIKSTLFVRNEKQKQVINEMGILYLPQQSRHWIRAGHMDELKPMDVYLVCVKQQGIQEVIEKLAMFKGTIIFLQNGMGHMDKLSRLNQQSTIMLATCEHGARRENQTTVTHTGMGIINIALFRGEKQELNKLDTYLNSAIFPTQIQSDWQSMLLNKLMINIVINPLTALYQVKNGELLTNRYLNRLAKAICHEAAQVFELNETEQWNRVEKIIEKTKENDSSMKVDLSKHRKTEIEAILGYMLKQASQRVPLAQFLYLSIKAMEQKGR